MGIYGALSSAVTGLRAQAHALENISGNIANSQTTGYKRIETDFLDLIPDAPISRQVPGAVLAQSRGTNNVQGDIKTVSDETFIALNSNGFFVVEPKVGQSDGNSVFAGTNYFTRRGDFQIDKDGLLVNGAGYYLKGLPIDTKTGNISGSVPEVIELSNNFLPAQKTSLVNYQANLPQLPKTTAYNGTVGSELIANIDYEATAALDGAPVLTANPTILGFADSGDTLTVSTGTPPSGSVTFEFLNSGGSATGTNVGVDIGTTAAPASLKTVLADMQAKLRASSNTDMASATVGIVDGNVQITLGSKKLVALTVAAAPGGVMGFTSPSVTDSPNTGLPVRLDTISAANDALFRSNSVAGGAVTVYAENGAPANVQMRWAKVSSAASGGQDTWNLFYMSESGAELDEPMWTNSGTDYVFNADGSMSLPDPAETKIGNLTVNGVNVGTVTLQHGENGISQFADVNGTASVSTLNQNGYGAGEFVSVAINDSGRVVATYSNGERIDMAQVVTAQFSAINSLKRLDGGVFSSTSESGEAILDLSGSGIIGGALEASNTDISDEFTKLIVTQQAYAAGTRIVSAADKMLQEALNMIR